MSITSTISPTIAATVTNRGGGDYSIRDLSRISRDFSKTSRELRINCGKKARWRRRLAATRTAATSSVETLKTTAAAAATSAATSPAVIQTTAPTMPRSGLKSSSSRIAFNGDIENQSLAKSSGRISTMKHKPKKSPLEIADQREIGSGRPD